LNTLEIKCYSKAVLMNGMILLLNLCRNFRILTLYLKYFNLNALCLCYTFGIDIYTKEQIKHEIQFEILREFVNLHKAINFLCKTTPGKIQVLMTNQILKIQYVCSNKNCISSHILNNGYKTTLFRILIRI